LASGKVTGKISTHAIFGLYHKRTAFTIDEFCMELGKESKQKYLNLISKLRRGKTEY
jgi:hypothetical protein